MKLSLSPPFFRIFVQKISQSVQFLTVILNHEKFNGSYKEKEKLALSHYWSLFQFILGVKQYLNCAYA